MSDLDNKRIISISDGANAMPVLWSINAKEIKYNNAIVMATAIARRVDKQNLWNGLINVTENIKSFKIKVPTKITVGTIKDKLYDEQDQILPPMIKYTFSEDIRTVSITEPKHISIGGIKESFPTPTAEKLPIGTQPLAAGNLSTTTLYVETRNPINVGSGTDTENIQAFTIIVTVGTTTYYPTITKLEVSQTQIIITLDSEVMKDSTQAISILYDSNLGTLQDSFNGGKVANFQTSFIYA